MTTSIDFATTIAALREQLEADKRLDYVDVSDGAGTAYAFDGLSLGAGFADGRLTVDEDGFVTVRIETGITIPEDLRPAVRKLFRKYNSGFIVEGLELGEDGTMVFHSAPVDIINGSQTGPLLAGRGMFTVHEFAGLGLALEAGAEPWDLLDYSELDDVDRGSVDAANGKRRTPQPAPESESDEDRTPTPEEFLEFLKHLMDDDDEGNEG